jgi:hypothetical protein
MVLPQGLVRVQAASVLPDRLPSARPPAEAVRGRKTTRDIGPLIPAGVVVGADVRVKSTPIVIRASASRSSSEVRSTPLIALDAGGYAIVDFKTALGPTAHLSLYFRQLHVYVVCLEDPAQGEALAPVEGMGLLYFVPSGTRSGSRKAGSLRPCR